MTETCGYYGCRQRRTIGEVQCYLHIGLEEVEGVMPCSKCKELKPFDAFNDNKRNGRKRSSCKKCNRGPETRTYNDRMSTEEKRKSTKSASIKNRFSISIDEYSEILFVKQNGMCALCDLNAPTIEEMFTIRFWPVDHDHRCCPGRHSCGKCVRGVLCDGCNNILKALWEDMEWRTRALTYLDRLQ